MSIAALDMITLTMNMTFCEFDNQLDYTFIFSFPVDSFESHLLLRSKLIILVKNVAKLD